MLLQPLNLRKLTVAGFDDGRIRRDVRAGEAAAGGGPGLLEAGLHPALEPVHHRPAPRQLSHVRLKQSCYRGVYMDNGGK